MSRARDRVSAAAAAARSLCSLSLAVAFAVALAACRYPATEVLVFLGTDAPPDRRFDVQITARASDGSAGSVHALARPDGGRGDSLGTFAVLPPRSRALDRAVTLELEATLAAAGPDQPAQRWRRTVRFAFVERRALTVRVFLPVYCGNRAEGCVSVGAEACTVSVRCEEQGLTCGDRGACVSPDLVPRDPDAGAPADATAAIDAAMDDCASPPVASAPTVLADFDDRVVPAAGPRAFGFAPASLSQVAVIEGGAQGSAAAVRVTPDVTATGVALQAAMTRQYLAGGTVPDPARGNAIEFYIRAPVGSAYFDATPGARTMQLDTRHWRPDDPSVGAIADSAMHGFAQFSLDPAGADRWLRVVLGPAALAGSFGYYHFFAAAAGSDELALVPSIREIRLIPTRASMRTPFDLDEVRLITVPPVAQVCPGFYTAVGPATDRDVLVPIEISNPTARERTYRVYISSVVHVAREDMLRVYNATRTDSTLLGVADSVEADGGRLAAELFEAGPDGRPTGPSVTVAGGAGIPLPAGGVFRGLVVHHVRAAMLGAPSAMTFGAATITVRRDTLTTSMMVWDPEEPARSSVEVRAAGSNADDARRINTAPGFPPSPAPPRGWTSRDVSPDQGVGTFVSVLRLVP